jgi:hypothetical protein
MSALTEDEAKTKWCPEARVKWAKRNGDGNNWSTRDGDPAFNVVRIERAGDEYHVGSCVGSSCMMWRWHEPWTSSTEEGVGGDLVLRLSRKPGEPKRGFCGLAGRPE